VIRAMRGMLPFADVEMILIAVILFVACLVPIIFFEISRGKPARGSSSAELGSRLRPVDIEAFCNLMDPDEEHFLRSSLPPSMFRSVHRERLMAAAEYVEAVSQNAAILTKIGQAARRHTDPSLAEAAQELANSGIRLRLQCSVVLLRLWTAILLPGTGLSSTSLVERYQHVSGLARRVSRLRYPSTPSEISAAG
jgi:hypothetical protein